MTVPKRTLALLVATVVATMWIGVAPATAAPKKLVATLVGGAAEVPDPGDPDGGGAAKVKVDVRKQKVCFTLIVVSVALPTAAAHIHEGGAGVAGDIVVTLKPPTEVADSGIGLSSGCVRKLPKPLLRDIRRNPGDYYVNVHNGDFPGGAVRGQLESA
jgi:hypothetical protein